jgi:hypothetical protein
MVKIFLTAVMCTVSLSLSLSAAGAQGVIYKWIDAHGIVHFSNAPTNRATPVDDELPPAASFTAPPEPIPPAAPAEPNAAAPTPPPQTAVTPAADTGPTAEDEPARTGSEPTTIEEAPRS